MNPDQLRDASLLELFAIEAESQTAVLNETLLELERDPHAAAHLEACMRAAHSIKGAARIVGLDAGVRLAHAMEDCLVEAQQGRLTLHSPHIDALLGATDLLQRISQPAHGARDDARTFAEIDAVLARLAALRGATMDDVAHRPSASGDAKAIVPAVLAGDTTGGATANEPTDMPADMPSVGQPLPPASAPRTLRVTATHLDTLLALTGEALVQANWLKPFSDTLKQTRHLQWRSLRAIEGVCRVPADW